MKKVCCLLLLVLNVVMAAPEVLTLGAEPGVWSMDIEEVMLQAKNRKMPVLLLFTGSDWCHWCKKLDEEFLSKTVWQQFAKENLMLGYLDFPKDEKKVPEQFRARNHEMAEKFGIEGYPTLVLVDENGGKITNIKIPFNEKPERFVFELRQPLRFLPRHFNQLTTTMPEAKKNAMMAERTKMEQNKKRIEDLKKEIERLTDEINVLDEKTDNEMDLWIVQSRLPEKAEEFKEFQTKYKALKSSYEQWLKTKPARTAENQEKYAKFMEEVRTLSARGVEILTEAMAREPK